MVLLGLHLAREQIETHPNINISINNQVAIRSIGNNHAQPAQYIIDEVKLAIGELVRAGHDRDPNNLFINTTITIMLTWVAGHMNSIGNEAADQLAKTATEFGSSDANLLPDFLKNDLLDSISATKQCINLSTSDDTRRWW